MKVLYVLPSGAMYGDNVALMGIMPYLVKYGVEPYFIVVQEGAIEDHLKAHGYEYEVIYHPYNMYPLSSSVRGFIHEIRCQLDLYGRFRSVKKAVKVVKCFAPDIIHTNTSTNLLGYIISRICKIPHVMHIREYMRLDHNYEYIPSKSFFIRLMKWSLNHNIAITPDINEYFESLNNTTVVYDGVVSENNVPSLVYQQKDNYILFVGRLVETKGIEEVIKIFCSAKINGHKLLIAGTGNDKYVHSLQEIAIKSNKEKDVIFLGFRSDIYELMQKAKAIIVSSRFEAFGFITAEAMYNGCVVIGRDTAGTKLQFDNGMHYYNKEIGLRYTSDEDLRKNIEYICYSNFSEFNNIRILAQKTVLNLYTKNKSAHEVLAVYNKILNNII